MILLRPYGFTVAATLLSLMWFADAALQPKPPSSSRTGCESRRRFLAGTAASFTVAVTSISTVQQEPAFAVAPITQQEADTGFARAVRLLRPNPPKILRQKLNLDFAVLLMRSSYAATDALDIIAMNLFQRDFFIIRSAEYEPYTKQLGPGYVKQGDLTDPSYFDFISFAQYTTVNRALSDPPTIFEEQQPVENKDDAGSDSSTPQKFETVVIRRTIPNNQLLYEYDKLVGRAILQYIDDTYGGTDSRLPQFGGAGRPTITEVEASLAQLVKLFLVNGFAWEGNVQLLQSAKDGSTGATFCLTLESPATIWSAQSLKVGRAQLRNDFLLKAAKQLALRMGYRVTSSSVKFDGNKELSYLSIS